MNRIVLAFVLVLAAAPAAAQDEGPADGQAQAHFQVGRAYYDTGRFPEAAHEFEEAYRLSQRPGLLYNVFVAHRDAGNLEEATRALRSYLELVPDAPERAALTARLATMERLMAERGGAAPASSNGESASETGPAARPASSGGGGTWMPGWIIAGVGAAAIVVSVITGVLVLDLRGQLDAMCTADGVCPAGFEGTRDEAAVLAGVTDGLLFGGIAVAALGVVLALVVSEGPAEQQTTVGCGLSGCTVRGRF